MTIAELKATLKTFLDTGHPKDFYGQVAVLMTSPREGATPDELEALELAECIFSAFSATALALADISIAEREKDMEKTPELVARMAKIGWENRQDDYLSEAQRIATENGWSLFVDGSGNATITTGISFAM